MVHVGCYVFHCVLPNLTSGLVLRMDWLHAINAWIDWHTYSLSLDFGGHTICIMGTYQGCFHAHIKVCALRLVLEMMFCDTISVWFGVLKL